MDVEILTEALPYIRLFSGKTIVIKYGGAAMEDPALRDIVAKDIVLLKYVGINPVLVHGGGPEISEAMKKLGKEPKFVNGLRVTDAETMEIAEMVLAGKINKGIVALINKHGGRAVGLCGKDANLIRAKRCEPVRVGKEDEARVDLGFVGDITEVNPEIVNVICREGFIPVVSSVAADGDGVSLNVNADYVAGHLAATLRAEKLILLTDVEGIFANATDPSSVISSLSIEDAERMIREGQISRGMIPKVESCLYALRAGVPRAHIIDGRVKHSLLLEIFTNKGIGTMMERT